MKVEFDGEEYDKTIQPIEEEELLNLLDLEDNKYRILNDILNKERECSKLLELFYIDDFNWKEIGEKLNITAANARQRKARCLKKIKQLMEKKLGLE